MGRSFFKDMAKEIKGLDICDVIEPYIDLPKKSAGEYLGLCPFHNDTRYGSFKVNPKKGIFKCFSCGVGGNSINFVSLYKNVNFKEAVTIIGKDHGLISMDDYESLMNTENQYSGMKNIETKVRRNANRNIKINEKILSDDILDRVFNIVLNESELEDEDLNYLVTERQIKEEIIEKRKYRSSNLVENEFIERVLEKLKEEFKDEDIQEILKSVPGFFKYYVNGKWEWRLSRQVGIYIPIRNYKNEIVGLQVRKREENINGGRYSWFSSSFGIGKDDHKYCTGQKARIDVIYPEQIISNAIFITEGRFKSEAIVDKIGAISLSVQGVSSWKGIDVVLKDIKEEMGLDFDNICIAFDMDTEHNNKVYNALKSMTDFLVNKFKDKKIYYVNWDKKYKGIDDFLLQIDCKEEIYRYLEVENKEDWDKEYSRQISNLLKIKGKSDIDKIDKEEIVKNIDVSASFKKKRGQI